MHRRNFLTAVTGVAGAVAGCLGLGESEQPPTQLQTTEVTQTETRATTLTEWERSTDCDSMHDSVIKVERVTSSLGDGYAPIHFAELSPEEKTILRTVTEEGGYGTCDPSDAFGRFVERVSDHVERQNANDTRIYLEREDTYYGLYVEDLDEVYAY